MELETMNKLYLELSQFVTARNERELMAERVYIKKVEELVKVEVENRVLRDALTEASHMIYGELYPDHPTVLKVRSALEQSPIPPARYGDFPPGPPSPPDTTQIHRQRG